MLDTAKFTSLGVLFAVSLVSGLILPYFVYRILSSRCQSGKFKSVLGVLNCFAGGVFLCTTLLTLLPEAREAMENVTSIDFPLTELLTAGGFLLILIIENVANSAYQNHQKKKSKPTLKATNTTATNVTSNGSLQNNDMSYQEGNVVVYNCSNDDVRVSDHTSGGCHPGAGQETPGYASEHHEHFHGLTNIRDLVLMIALSIHMVFDGLGIGLLDEESKVWSVLIAVSIHRVPIFFSTGLTICSSNTTRKFVIAMVYMALVSAVGLGIGIAISSQGEGLAVSILSAVLQGLAVGTFLYVAICEILTREFEHATARQRIHKVFAVCLGCMLLAVISYFA